jgi:hypothetical protein
MSEAEFSRVVSEATLAGTLEDLYRKIDTERRYRELQWLEDESNLTARSAYARSVQRRLIVLLSLPGRFEDAPDLVRQVKQVESVISGPLDQ